MSAIEEIKSRIDIIDLVSSTVKLRRTGKNYIGFCPFHTNTRTPAFVVFPDSGTWRCFGECNEGGDIFRYIMKKEGWNFPETLRYLAERAGVTLESHTPEQQAEEEEHERLRTLLEEAVTFYRHHLLQTPGGQPALQYLQKRGLQTGTIEAFELGYAPEGWDAALKHFTAKGYTQQELVEAGMVTERQEKSGVYDRFRNRIMIPIRDARGRMAGFGARILNPEDMPKFLNSPQTPVFDKGRLLYGLFQARKNIRAQDQAVIVEGYLDVIALHQAGFANAVSPMGTALTEDQLHLLKRFSRRIVLALDADAAGEKATLRGLEVARQAMDKTEELVFDARGLLRHEARLQADVRVTTLPPGKDPDDVVLNDPAEWQRILDEARPIVIHVMESLAASRNLDDPKTKSEIATQVLPLIADVPDAVERDAYRQRLARLLKVDERALGAEKGTPAQGRRRPRMAEQPRPAKDRAARISDSPEKLAHSMEVHILRLLLRDPANLYTLNRVLQAANLSRFDPQDLEDASHQAIASLVMEGLKQEQMEPSVYLVNNIPEPLTDSVREMLQPLEHGEPNDQHKLEDLIRTVMMLRLIRVNEGIRQMRFMQEDMQSQGEHTLMPYQDLIPQYILARGRLETALGKPFQLD